MGEFHSPKPPHDLKKHERQKKKRRGMKIRSYPHVIQWGSGKAKGELLKG